MTVLQHKYRNTLHTALLLVCMILLLMTLGYSLFGLSGTLFMLFLSALLILFTPKASAWLTLRLYHAQPLPYLGAVSLYQLVEQLSDRAGLLSTPALFLVPSSAPNAFAMQENRQPLIALTDGLLRQLNSREITAVLAHEISHIRNDDLNVMMLADLISRITAALAHTGWLLLLIFLPLWLVSETILPWLTLLLLLFAPAASMLLQFALSRTREFDADMDAADLSGDPLALASALVKIQQAGEPWWQRLLFPGQQQAIPSLLRTHPATDERIKRLQLLAASNKNPTMTQEIFAPHTQIVIRPGRWHPFGIWY